ncbi:MAG: hypothetical protein JO051_06465, partial [Acidobacteriaceae bacterium]|nr:hypothetical protein [Acidobacteriaceae bacterium]
PEPFSNIVLSLAGDALTVGGTLLMALHPVVWVAIVLVAVLLSVLVVRWIFRGLSRLFRSAAPAVR